MIYSRICIIVILNILMLSSISTVALATRPNWLIFSRYKVLKDIQYIIYFVSVLIAGSLYEAHDSLISRTRISYLDIITKEIPRALFACAFILIFQSIIIHYTRFKASQDSSIDKSYMDALEKIIKNDVIIIILLVNVFALEYGSLYAVLSIAPILLLPYAIEKSNYCTVHFIGNSQYYWTGVFIVQGLIVFKDLIFCFFSVAFM